MAAIAAFAAVVVVAIGWLTIPRRSPPPPAMLRVRSVAPADDSKAVQFDPSITVTFSGAIARLTRTPYLMPAVNGHWVRRGSRQLVFAPASQLAPGKTYSLVIPGGSAGVHGTNGSFLGRTVTAHFTVALPSYLRLEQLLAELDYLPVGFVSAGHSASVAIAGEPTDASKVPLVPQAGTFAWRFPALPTALTSLWQPGGWSAIEQGAVMAFEAAHQLTVDGEPGPNVWAAILHAVADRQLDPNPYNYLEATESSPERLDVWSDGQLVVSTLANTGAAPNAVTPLGTWPVRLRLVSATMSGINPDGTHYVDHGVPDVAYFYGSDAVHGFSRPAYGFPQSNGCVEVPLSVAEEIYRFDPIGTLVSVVDGALPG